MKKLSFLLILSLLIAFPLPQVAAEQSSEPAPKIGSNFWFMTDNSGEKPFKDNIDWSVAYSQNQDIWNPSFIEEIEVYPFLRFMDWGGTNNSNVVSWSQRRLPNVPQEARFNGGNSTQVVAGAAYEWLIDLCNRTDKDLWLCVPHKADDNFIQELAKLVKEKLKPGLKCFIEYSNETWNNGFAQNRYVVEQGKALKLPGNDDQYIGEAFNVYRSLQIFDIFQKVYGAEMKDRVVRICSISGYYEWFRTSYRNVAYDHKYNPARQQADVLCTAPYVGFDLDGTSATVVQDFKADVDRVYKENVLKGKKIANEFGLRYGTYEGGQHLLLNADVFSKNPEIYDCYKYMLDKFLPEFEFFTHYAHCGTPASGGAWGAKFFTGQPIEQAHRYRALKDWAEAHPVHKQPSAPAALKAPKVGIKFITDRTKTITGTYTGNTDIILKVGSKTYKTIPDAWGDYKLRKLDFSKVKDGSKISVYAMVMRNGLMVKSPAKTYKLIKLPKDVKLSTKTLKTTTTSISGSTSAKAKVKIVVGKKSKIFRTGSNGKFKIKVSFKEYKKGTKVKFYSFRAVGKTELKTKVLTIKLK